MKKISKKKTTKTMNTMDKKRTIWGYVNATGRQSEIINENGERIIETIHPYSFEETLKSGQDIKFRLNHEKPLGQRGQNLKLKEDNVGLYADGFVQDEETIGKIDRGEIAGWSLQFYDVPGGTSSWRDQQGIIHRDIYKLDLREVSLIDIDHTPAYAATSIHSRTNGDGKRTIYNFISGYEPIHSRSIPMPQLPQYMPQYASVPQYMAPYASVPPQYVPQYASVPQYVPQYVSVPQYVVSMPSVEPRNPVVPGASFEVKTPDKENAEKGSEAKTEPAEAKEKPKAESKVEAEEKPKAESKVEAEEKPKEEPKVETKEEPKAESKVETKDEDNKNIDLSEIMKELSSDTNTIKKYYKNEV